ncbi:MAG: copper resistance protein CopC/CopD [Actinobacteria bacterium]|nr:copper resistance protein CopC/CopD [Actinomycetota bacterium]
MTTQRPVGWLVAAVLLPLVLLVLVGSAVPASAHASLAATTPADGSTVVGVEEVTLEFNEAATVPTGGIRVFDAAAERVDDARIRAVDDRTAAVGVSDLPDGDYIVTWRAVSADGHPIRGAFVFSVGTRGEVDDALVARLFAGDGGAVAGVLAGLVRAVGYLGTLLAGGALAYRRWVARSDRERDRSRRWAVRGAAGGAGAAVLTVPLQAMAVTGFGPVAALAPEAVGPVLVSPTGQAAVLRLVALVGVLLLARRSGTAAAVAGAVAVVSFVLEGHTRTVEPLWLLVTADLVHVTTAALWFGGLVVLVAALRERSFDDDPVAAAGLVSRYSTLATASVVAVTVAGGAMSWALVRHPRALTSTAYGWTLAGKLSLAVVVIAIGVLNNRRLVPAIRRASGTDGAGASSGRAGWDRLRRVTRVEVALMVAVLLVTAFLVNLRPASEAAGITAVFETTAAVTDELTLNLVVDPNRAGDNQIHLYLLDTTGRPSGDVEDVTLRLSLPERDIGPIERETFVAGPGHWQLNGSELSIAGEWLIEVVVRVDRFTEEVVSVPVVVNPS